MSIRSWVVGDGPSVVLVHAGVADSRMWARQVSDLSRDHRVITVDLRGFGETPVEPKYSDARDLLAVLDEVGAEQVAAVGASYGGYVVQQAACHSPERFSRVIQFCSPTDNVVPTPDLRAVWDEENRLVEAGDLDGAAELTVEKWIGPDADDEARELLRTMQRRAYELQVPAGDVDNEELPVDPARLTMPVRMFTGAKDFAWFTDCANYLAERLPDGQIVELPWAGHLPTLERPEEGTALIRAALS
ncbi:alpha/beta hydrolase [Kribbella sp. NPDC006257]|uniref:alpha/beta fold hydrolase n=1 Tax=Kribbella sp. NPDC006257 TaxID=3156738 RepID=UPI0033AF8F8A